MRNNHGDHQESTRYPMGIGDFIVIAVITAFSIVGEIPNGMLGVVEGGGHLNFSCEASHRDFRGDR